MRLSWILIAALAWLLSRASAPAPARAQVIVVAPQVPHWRCDESCYLAMDRVPGPYDCLGCPAQLQGPPWTHVPPDAPSIPPPSPILSPPAPTIVVPSTLDVMGPPHWRLCNAADEGCWRI